MVDLVNKVLNTGLTLMIAGTLTMAGSALVGSHLTNKEIISNTNQYSKGREIVQYGVGGGLVTSLFGEFIALSSLVGALYKKGRASLEQKRLNYNQFV